MRSLNNIFDDNYMKINDYAFKRIIFVFILIAILFLIVIFIKKEKLYKNAINFINNKEAYILTDAKVMNNIVEEKSFYLNNVKYDYNVVKIEEQESMYLIYVNFSMELDVNVNTYTFVLEKESILKYIVRKLKGE